MERVIAGIKLQHLLPQIKAITPTQVKRYLIACTLIIFLAPAIEIGFYLFSFNFVVYENFVSWYFPAGVRVVCYLFFPLRYWPALTIAFTLGQILYTWHFYDEALSDIPYRLAKSMLREYLILLPVIAIKLLKIPLNINTVKNAVIVIFAAISYRLIRSIIIIAFNDRNNKYRLIADEERFEMILAHQLGGIIPILIMLLLFFSGMVLYKKWHILISENSAKLIGQLIICLCLFITAYQLEPKSLYLLRMLAIFPLIWFSYSFGALGALSYGSITVITLLVNVYGSSHTELMLNTQLYIITYSVLAILLSAFVTELNKSKTALLNQNKELIELSSLTQNLATKVVNVQESERSQLSQELHDDIGQNLTALKTNIAILEKKSASYNELDNTILRLKNVSNHMYDSVYRLMHWLRPRLLDELGLEAALKSELFSENLKDAGVSYSCKINGPVDTLTENYKIAIFRICQEASTNTMKHSLATEFSIDIAYNRDQLEIIIKDNGIGLFEQSNSNFNSGFGIIGIYERVAVLNGECKFKNNTNGGLTITIQFTTK